MSEDRCPRMTTDRVGPPLRQAGTAAAGRVSRKTQEADTSNTASSLVTADRVRVSRKAQEVA